MGIQSTRYITREEAIERICYIYSLAAAANKRALDGATGEYDYDVRWFLEEGEHPDIRDIANWTDSELEEWMDEPFYRHSMFENYNIWEE